MSEIFAGLLSKTWTMLAVSPLFRDTDTSTTLDSLKEAFAAFVASRTGGVLVDVHKLSTDASYRFPNPLLFTMTVKSVETVSAVLIPKGRTANGGPFLDTVCLLIRGQRNSVTLFREWFHRHFDCSSAFLQPNPFHLSSILGVWLTRATLQKPVQLKYALPCSGIDHVTLTIDGAAMTRLIGAIQSESTENSQSKPSAQLGKDLLAALANHFSNVLHIDLTHASLVSIVTADAAVSCDGRLKIFLPNNVNMIVASLWYFVKDPFV
eukprot:c8321_g1_i1.p1 GENE.c8321_g1_i1~~c8321_g1_i1.p1  ORF type:complete len:265 (+),score=26.96 c8321_g1_i1:30-824(+)